MYFNCPKCNSKLNKLHYVLAVNGTKHLAGYCKIHKTVFIERIESLKIPTKFSKKALQPKLL